MEIDEQILELEEKIARTSDDATLLFELGRLYWKRGDKAKAISLYTQSEELDPQGPASIALEQARSIMDFFNPDLLNP